MASRSGPPRKPTKLTKLAGNPGHRKKEDLRDEVEPPMSSALPPTLLKGEAKKEWARIAPVLIELGLLSELDRTMLSAFCRTYARYIKSEKEIERLGEVHTAKSGYLQLNAWLTISNTCVEQMRKTAVEFGFSPAARVRLKATGDGKKDPKAQSDAEFFGEEGTKEKEKGGNKGSFH